MSSPPVNPRRRIRKFRSALLFAAGLLLPATAFAQFGSTVEILYPQVGQAGTTVEVIVEGNFLDAPQQVLFYQQGIRCTNLTPITEVPDGQTSGTRKVELGKAARLTFQIDQRAAAGEHQLRVRTKDNLSELITFWVTHFPVVFEAHPWTDRDVDGKPLRNDTPQHAQAIRLNSTVAGYLPKGLPQDDDWYVVQCTAGQRLSVEVVAARLGTHHYSGMNDPAVSIFDEQNKLIGRNDDNALFTQDPVVSVAIPHDGRYFIHMRQQMDYETTMRHYLIHVGTFARPLVAFPLGGETGTSLPLKLLGDARGVLATNVQLPSNPGLFEKSYRNVTPPKEGAEPAPPALNRIHVAPFGNVLEAIPQSEKEAVDKPTPQSIDRKLPLAINGRIESEGEVDWYRFHAKKGKRFRVRAYAKTLDSELDARIWIRPAEGNPSKLRYDEDDSRWEPHDLVGHHYREQIKDRLDPIFMFEPDTDGPWLIGIGDTRREFGERHIYRVEFQPHVDSAFVYFPAYPSRPEIYRDRIVLFPGHSYTRPLGIQPGFGSKYSKPLQLRALRLPDGVTMRADRFTQNDGIIPVEFHAAADAKIGAETIDLMVEPVDRQDRDKFRGGFIQCLPATDRRGGFAMYFDKTRKMALAVVEGANFNLSIDPPKTPLVRNGELALTVRVQRHGDFKGDVYCEMDWLPQGVSKQPPLIIPSGKTHALYKIRATSSASPGEHSISITGRENEGGIVRTAAGLHHISSPSVTLSVGEPYLTIQLARAAIERDTIGAITAEITHHKKFTGTATLKLGRLPFGVTQVAPFPTIKPGEKSATFRVKVTRDCLVGQYKDIFCDVTIQDRGEQISQQTGSGILRVDPERIATN